MERTNMIAIPSVKPVISYLPLLHRRDTALPRISCRRRYTVSWHLFYPAASELFFQLLLAIEKVNEINPGLNACLAENYGDGSVKENAGFNDVQDDVEPESIFRTLDSCMDDVQYPTINPFSHLLSQPFPADTTGWFSDNSVTSTFNILSRTSSCSDHSIAVLKYFDTLACYTIANGVEEPSALHYQELAAKFAGNRYIFPGRQQRYDEPDECLGGRSYMEMAGLFAFWY